MAISNAIAQFGQRGTGNVGAGIAYGQNALRMQEDNRRYQNALAAQKQDEERQFASQWAQSLAQAKTPEEKAMRWQGGYNELLKRGIDLTNVPPDYSPEAEQRLFGATGVSPQAMNKVLPSGIQEHQYHLDVINNPGRFTENQVKASKIALGIEPRATGSSAITVATTHGLTDQVAGSESIISGAKTGASEKSKLQQQMEYKPMIEAAVVKARKAAEEKGQVFNELSQAQAALPGLEQVIGQLKSLAPIATHTYTGRAFNAVVRELGFGSTDGATARAQYISLINNQVLPLLRPTFGAAFTVAEGESLKATMGDPNLSPEEKIVVLETFIQNKYREIETKQRQLGENPRASQLKKTDIDALVNKYAD